ncbi:MAG: AAA family ATPase [Candidatus Nanopelagicales bacterium]|jgi:chromosome partitioning protein|nr:AAA family ATPase [Candidatus Nanopelagicales bacterium]
MTRVLAVANQKGGVAKTTTVVNLAAALAELGRSVLVVDLDAQACATFSLGIDPEDLATGVMDVFRGTSAIGLIQHTADGVDVLPAKLDLAGADQLLATKAGREFVLRDALKQFAGTYDWIILDCSPSLGIITINALAAADEVIIPLQCETLSHRGVGQLMGTISDVQRLVNPRLRVSGILPTLFDGRTAHARSVLADLGPRYGFEVLAPISRSIRFAEAPAAGRSILATAPSSKGAREYRSLATQLDQ